eukprot:gene1944-biopygen7892
MGGRALGVCSANSMGWGARPGRNGHARVRSASGPRPVRVRLVSRSGHPVPGLWMGGGAAPQVLLVPKAPARAGAKGASCGAEGAPGAPDCGGAAPSGCFLKEWGGCWQSPPLTDVAPLLAAALLSSAAAAARGSRRTLPPFHSRDGGSDSRSVRTSLPGAPTSASLAWGKGCCLAKDGTPAG